MALNIWELQLTGEVLFYQENEIFFKAYYLELYIKNKQKNGEGIK